MEIIFGTLVCLNNKSQLYIFITLFGIGIELGMIIINMPKSITCLHLVRSELTSIHTGVLTGVLKVLLKQYMFPISPKKFNRGITPAKVNQKIQKSNLFYIKLRQIHKPNVMSISKTTTEKSPENLKHVKVGQERQKENLTCITSRQIHVSNFKSNYLKRRQRKYFILAKGNDSCKTGQTRLKSNLTCITSRRQIHVSKFKINISKDGSEQERRVEITYLTLTFDDPAPEKQRMPASSHDR